MKWYIFEDDVNNNKYKLILDHSILVNISWNIDENDVTYELSGAKQAIDGLNWDSSINRRIISASEIDTITGGNHNNGWYYFDSGNTNSATTGTGTSKYAWLYNHQAKCSSYGCEWGDDTGTSAYFTSDVSSDSKVWCISREGRLALCGASYSNFRSVRPVIEVDKSIIN